MTTTTITGLPNAATPLSGAERVPLDQTIGTAIAATALSAGTGYRIESVGSTNWAACGLPAGVTAAVGLTFVATAAGTGTGTAIAIETRDAAAADIAALAPPTNLNYDAPTRVLSSSTGDDVILPLAGAEAGLISAADQAKLTSIVLDRAKLTVADVRNNSGVSIPKGAPVYVTGSSGTIKTVALADASLEATAANTLGLAADTIANNSDGLVITEGPLTGLNTAGLTEGQLIWLSETTGAITSTRPTQPAHGVVLGWCVKTGAGSAGILYVKVDNGLELNELHDVLITSPATGQVLRRAADGLWKNAALDVGDVANAVATNDARLSDARAPLAHIQTASTISDFSAAVTGLFTTVGNALRTLANPSAVSFLRLNADNSVTARSASEMRGDLGLGSAALGTIGTAAGNVVALDGSARLPAVDGSQLTGLPAAFNPASPGAIGGTTPAAGTFTRLTLPAQSVAPSTPASGFSLYANSSNALSWVGGNGFIRTFDGTANTANRTYTLPDASGTLTLQGLITGSGLTMATARLLGRSTASTGAVEEISLPTGFDLSGGALRAPAEIGIACSDETGALTIGAAKVTLRMPYAMTLTSVRLSVTTAPTGSALIVDVNEAGTSVFSTNPRIDAGSTTSVGSGTPAVISDTALADNAVITIDIDQIGSTVAGAGLKVWLIGRRA